MDQNSTPQLPETFFTNVFNEYYRPLFFFIRNLIVNSEDAREIANDTMVKLWFLRDRFSSSQNIKAFLYVTARNASLTYLRNTQRNEERQKGFALFTEKIEEAFDRSMMLTEIVTQAYHDIEKVKGQPGVVLKMFFVEGLTVAEIAKRLGITEKNVHSQKSKGVSQLRVMLLKRGLLSIPVIVTIRHLYDVLHHYIQSIFR